MNVNYLHIDEGSLIQVYTMKSPKYEYKLSTIDEDP